jgi:hypothetical protein
MSEAARRLAQLAIAYEKAHEVFFPAAAEEMATLASLVMAEEGVRYWISPGGDSITCTKCRRTSRNPQDVAQRYCGHCHVFHDDQRSPA